VPQRTLSTGSARFAIGAVNVPSVCATIFGAPLVPDVNSTHSVSKRSTGILDAVTVS
jgi:hypothetical protein